MQVAKSAGGPSKNPTDEEWSWDRDVIQTALCQSLWRPALPARKLTEARSSMNMIAWLENESAD